MTTIRLTKRNIDAIPTVVAGQAFYWDSDLAGFGLRAGTKSKVFFAERQVARRTVRVTIGKYGLVTPEAARKKALKLLGEMAEGRDPNGERKAKRASAMTVREAFDDFFERRALAASSRDGYQRSMDLYLKDWSSKPIGEISRRMVLDRHRKIGEENGLVTANNVFRHFRSVYNFTSAAHGELPPNPVAILTQARAWNAERRRRSVIPLHGLPKWWRAVHQEEEYVRDFLLIALFTGMRRSEIARLRWEYIDLEGRTLTVPTTKNGDPLELPLSDFLFNLLLTRRDHDPEGEWVFPGRGETGHMVETKKFYARVSKSSGVKFTLHDLRRTFITIAESLDIPHYALKRLLNHRTDGDVTGGYIVIDVERLRGPVERVAERILQAAKPNAQLTLVGGYPTVVKL
jgi:integrase